MRMIILSLFVGFLLLLFFFTNAQAVVNVDTNFQWVVGNETYKVNDTNRVFSRISWSDKYIVFNNTGFNISSGDSITVYIDYLNSSIIDASEDDLILEFVAITSGGVVWFNISGLEGDQNYTIKRNGTLISSQVSNISGGISFSNSVWSDKVFEIYKGAEAGDGISYNMTGYIIDTGISKYMGMFLLSGLFSIVVFLVLFKKLNEDDLL